MIIIPQCFFCQRFHRDGKRTCDAYPDGIPPELFKSEVGHIKPYKGDHGLTFLDVIDGEAYDQSALLEEMQYTGGDGAEAKEKTSHDLAWPSSSARP